MRLIPILALLMALALPRHAPADEPADAIRSVIESQLEAFQQDDLSGAFSHASPGIQEIFRTPEMFGRMVRTGYPMVWRPARYQMLGLVETPAGTVQMVLFEDNAGRLHEAAYLMQEVDGVWRIAGVRLRQLPSVGA